jgi:prolyl oligopeptidase
MRGVLLFGLLSVSVPASAIDYPETRRGAVVEQYHGQPVADPYRWLEDVDAPETLAWVRAQNAVSLPFLAALPGREAIRERLTALWNYERFELPEKKAGKLLFRKNDGLQNQSVLYVQDGPASAPRVLIDPNTLSADGTVALTQWKLSPDGRWLAYGIAGAGSDWNEFRVREVASGKDAPETLGRVKFSAIEWTADSKGFFYSRYPAAQKQGDQTFDELQNQRIYYHRLGQPQDQDVLVYAVPEQPKWNLNSEVAPGGRWHVIYAITGTGTRNALYVQDLGDPLQPDLGGPVHKIVDRFEAQYTLVGAQGDTLLLFTNDAAPQGRVVAIDLKRPAPQHWKTVIAERRDTLQRVIQAGGELVAVYMRDATSRLLRYSLDGRGRGEIAMPALGALSDSAGVPAISGGPDSHELFYSFTSYSQPPTNYRVDLKSGRNAVFQAPRLNFRPGDYVTRQVFYTSKDGTRVPMFISHRKGLKKSKQTPTMLYGYGGFDISLTPSFSVPNLVWMERGGILAVPNLRGGGEYGRAWHQAGTQARKQNVFDDFAAAAGYLIANDYTSSRHLCIQGRSNGGLLVGATLNQHPGLFACALPGVGVMDMLRYHKFTIGWAWAEDYGTSDTPEGFEYLIRYSPVHNVLPGARYPAVLVTTADHDDRVVPGHSFKYAAAMQHAQAGDAPVLIRIDVKAGHGAGKPLAKTIEEFADMYAFAWHFASPAP